VTVPWTRNERGALAGIKSTSYGENARALADAKSRGAGEAILANTRGELCEGTGTNIFIVHDSLVKTPPLESGCLAGVTRALVIEACQHAGIAIREETMPLSILETCQEAFLTSSTRDVHPLAAIDGRKLPGESAAMTQRVAQAFRGLIAGKDDP
jgi:branched-chain amino acid aminotransferase